MSKAREFWVDPEPDGDDGYVQCFQALSRHPQQGPLQWQASLVHVIEKSAYQKAIDTLRKISESTQQGLPWMPAEPSSSALKAIAVLKELGDL